MNPSFGESIQSILVPANRPTGLITVGPLGVNQSPDDDDVSIEEPDGKYEGSQWTAQPVIGMMQQSSGKQSQSKLQQQGSMGDLMLNDDCGPPIDLKEFANEEELRRRDFLNVF